jgi:hypothetical protein
VHILIRVVGSGARGLTFVGWGTARAELAKIARKRSDTIVVNLHCGKTKVKFVSERARASSIVPEIRYCWSPYVDI